MVALVSNQESAIWKDACLVTLLGSDQLQYIDFEGMQMWSAEHIKSDKVENVATSGVKIGEFGKVGKRLNFEKHRNGWSQNLNKKENRRLPKHDEQRQDQDQEKLRKSMIKGLAMTQS